jgi:hypothetical protein
VRKLRPREAKRLVRDHSKLGQLECSLRSTDLKSSSLHYARGTLFLVA